MAHVKITAIFTTAFFLIAAGTVANGWQMYFMASVLLALPLASLAVGRASLYGLSVSRELPSPAWAGDLTPLTLKVRASGRWPRLLLEARDDLPKLIRRTDSAPHVFDVPAGGEARVAYDVEPLKRGVYSLKHVTIQARDPMGLFAFNKRFPAPGELVVYPVPEAVGGLELSGADRHGTRDRPHASARGSGTELDGVRQYSPGDPLRRMHWKSLARTGELHVIEFEEVRSLNVVLALDCYAGGSVGGDLDNSFEYLVRAAASLAQEAVRMQASVELVAGHAGAAGTSAGRGPQDLMGVLASLARVEANDTVRISQRLAAQVGTAPRGTTLVVLTADEDPALSDALALYSAIGVRMLVVWADASSFKGDQERHGEDASAFLSSLLGLGAEALALRRTASGRLSFEPVGGLHAIA